MVSCSQKCKDVALAYDRIKDIENVPTPCDVLISKAAITSFGRGSPGNLFMPDAWGTGHLPTLALCAHIGRTVFGDRTKEQCTDSRRRQSCGGPQSEETPTKIGFCRSNTVTYNGKCKCKPGFVAWRRAEG